MEELDRLILSDAVTSGGLLISVPKDQGERLLNDLHAKGIEWAKIIGEVVSDHPGKIQVISDKS
jgi:selenide,water dikinase